MKRNKIELRDMLLTFFVPMLIGKTSIIWLAALYASYPDEGWGRWLAASIAFTLVMVARFLWKYRNYED